MLGNRLIFWMIALAGSLWLPKNLWSTPEYAYALGVYTQNQVAPGTQVSIQAELQNLGSLPILFGGSTGVSAGIGSVAGDYQWQPVDTFTFANFSGEFSSVRVNPGEVFSFRLGTFAAPANLPLGARGGLSANFLIDYTSVIAGNLLGFARYGVYSYDFNNTPTLTYTLANTPSQTNLSFYQALVINTLTGEVISAPPTFVPEPTMFPLILVGLGVLSLGGSLRKRLL